MSGTMQVTKIQENNFDVHAVTPGASEETTKIGIGNIISLSY